MQVYTKYILFCFLLAASLPLAAQKVKLTTNTSTKYATALSKEDRQAVVRATETLLTEYSKAATLLDESNRQVTGNSIDRFRGLFNPTALIMKDYEENYQGELVNVRVYADGVFNRMQREGIKVKVGNAVLKEIKDDAAGYWVMIVELEKIIYNAVTAKQEVKDFPSGRFIKQQFRIDIKKSEFERAKIASIKCVDCGDSVAADYVRYLGPSIGVFTGTYNPSLSAFWNNNHASSSLETTGNAGFSIGFDFLTNKFASSSSGTKNLFLSGGLHFALYKLNTELKDLSMAAFPATAVGSDATELPYSRIAGPIAAEEKLSLGVLEIPLGIMYRLKSGIKSDIMIGAKLIPAFVLSGSGDINGTGTYDAELSEAMWRLLESGASNPMQRETETKFGPFQAGENQVISESANPSTAGFLLMARLSPTYYYHLSEDDASWSLLIGLDLNIHLGSFLEHDDANSDILQFKDDYETSLLQHYTDGLSGFSFGLRIGLHHRLTTQP